MRLVDVTGWHLITARVDHACRNGDVMETRESYRTSMLLDLSGRGAAAVRVVFVAGPLVFGLRRRAPSVKTIDIRQESRHIGRARLTARSAGRSTTAPLAQRVLPPVA